MTREDERELENELARLQQEHRDLDAAIDALHQWGRSTQRVEGRAADGSLGWVDRPSVLNH